MSRVFVVQMPHQLSPRKNRLVPKFPHLVEQAEHWGEVIFLLTPTASPFNSQPIIRELHTKLWNFSDEDYLVLVGSPWLIGLTTAIAALHNQGRVKGLQWSGRDNQYKEVSADVSPGGE